MRRNRDIDAFDAVCDHLLVLDNSIEGDPEDQIVGTYRLLRQETAFAYNGFYSASEFDIEGLIARHPGKRFMELGRSCVLPQYRTKRTVELLWQGNWAYAVRHRMDAMIGCASFPVSSRKPTRWRCPSCTTPAVPRVIGRRRRCRSFTARWI